MAAFKRLQQDAFLEERERWASAKADESFEAPAAEAPAPGSDDVVPEGCRPVRSPITASVWTVAVETGQCVELGQKLLVLEAMKTEIVVAAPTAGTIEKLNCSPGALVYAGQQLVALRPRSGI